MKPTDPGTVKDIFGADDSISSEDRRSKRLNLESTTTFEAQKDVVIMV